MLSVLFLPSCLALRTRQGNPVNCPLFGTPAFKSSLADDSEDRGLGEARRLKEAAPSHTDLLKETWDQIISNTKSKGYMNPLQTLGYAGNPAYLENMTTHSEVYWDGPAHQKITHGIGGHAKAHFKWYNNSYSGMFQQADSCVIRMANAAEPVHGTPYNPNLAIKCYRSDGMESANIQTLWEIDGYNVLPPNRAKSCSMFGAPLSNHCGYRDNISMPLKDYFIKDFDKVSPRSMWIGASQLAVGTQDGVAIAPQHTNFPFALVFDPAPGAADTECTYSTSRYK